MCIRLLTFILPFLSLPAFSAYSYSVDRNDTGLSLVESDEYREVYNYSQGGLLLGVRISGILVDDRDGDGYNDDVDAFPDDATEWSDNDSDGQGDNADTDDDNDNMPDVWETANGLDPLDDSDAVTDSDGDGDSNLTEYQNDTDPNDETSHGGGGTASDGIISACGNGGSLANAVLHSDGRLARWGWLKGFASDDASKVSIEYVEGLPKIKSLACGGVATYAISEAGTVYAWGSNVDGELGSGNTVASAAPKLVPGLSDVVSMTAGNGSAYALRSDGSVWAWGNDYHGQLGNGSASQADVLLPQPVTGLSNVVSIAAGYYHFVGVDSAGDVWVMGQNKLGQLGLGESVGDGDNKRVYAPQKLGQTLNAVKAFSYAGAKQSFVLTDNGDVWGWGSNNGSGEFVKTDVSPRASYIPEKVSSGVSDFVVGLDFRLALKRDGTFSAWGFNNKSQFGVSEPNYTGVETSINLSFPSPIGEISFADYRSTFALLEDGSLWVWGQLRDPNNEFSTYGIPTKLYPGLIDFPEPAVDSDGDGYNDDIDAFPDDPNEWEDNDSDGTGDNADTDDDNDGMPDVWELEFGFDPLNGSDASDDDDHDGASNLAEFIASTDPTDAASVPEIVADGIRFACGSVYQKIVIHNDGRVARWGYIVGSSSEDGSTKIPVEYLQGLPPMQSAACGLDSALLLSRDGDVYGWGANGSGEVGVGDILPVAEPTKIVGLADIASIAAGEYSSYAINRDGEVWVWGADHMGELGDGPATSGELLIPTKLENVTGMVEIAAGKFHALALDNTGQVWATGRNSKGSLGLGENVGVGDKKLVHTFTKIPSMTGVSHIYTNPQSYQSFFLKSSSEIWGTGASGGGGLFVVDDQNTADVFIPIQLTANASDMVVGTFHRLVLDENGSLVGWGRNSKSEFGAAVPTYSASGEVVDLALGTSVYQVQRADIEANFLLGQDGSLWVTGNVAMPDDNVHEVHTAPFKIYPGLIDFPEPVVDSDGDGYNDDEDAFPDDPTEWADNDSDGTGDNTDADDDNDGMPDVWETTNGLDPFDSSDAFTDLDGDGLANLVEYQRGTDPTVPELGSNVLPIDDYSAQIYGVGMEQISGIIGPNQLKFTLTSAQASAGFWLHSSVAGISSNEELCFSFDGGQSTYYCALAPRGMDDWHQQVIWISNGSLKQGENTLTLVATSDRWAISELGLFSPGARFSNDMQGQSRVKHLRGLSMRLPTQTTARIINLPSWSGGLEVNVNGDFKGRFYDASDLSVYQEFIVVDSNLISDMDERDGYVSVHFGREVVGGDWHIELGVFGGGAWQTGGLPSPFWRGLPKSGLVDFWLIPSGDALRVSYLKFDIDTNSEVQVLIDGGAPWHLSATLDNESGGGLEYLTVGGPGLSRLSLKNTLALDGSEPWGFHLRGASRLGKSSVSDLDGDLVPDDVDDFPREPNEWSDLDLDGYGDNYADAFPDDPSEWADNDSDGTGDNTDADDDNDGLPDVWESQYGLDPLDASDADADSDSDGVSNLDEYTNGTDPSVFNYAPSVTRVSPLRAVLGQSTVFTVEGAYLTDTLALQIDACEGISVISSTPAVATFRCTPSVLGSMPGEVLIGAAGEVLFSFTVDVEEAVEMPSLQLNSIDETLFGSGVAGGVDVDDSISIDFELEAPAWLTLRGFDIDSDDELCIKLNGVAIGCLKPSENDQLSHDLLFWLGTDLLNTRDQHLVIEQKTPGEKWGVDRLGLFDVAMVLGPDDSVANFVYPEGFEIFVPANSDWMLDIAGFDVDHNQEIRVEMAGAELGYFPAGNDADWDGVYNLLLPENDSDAWLRISNAVGLDELWAVLLGQPQFNEAVFDVANGSQSAVPATQSVPFLVPASVAQLKGFQLHDFDHSDEVTLVVNGVVQSIRSAAANDSWTGVSSLNLPQSGLSLVILAATNPSITDGWAVRWIDATPQLFLTPNAGSTLSAGPVEFSWEAVDGAERYALRFGSSSGGREYGLKAVGGSVTSYSSNLLPTDGSVVYVTLSSFQGGVWTRHGTEEFVSAPEPLRVFTFPAVGSTLTAGSAEFGWEAVDGVERYVLRFGSSSGGREYGLKAVGGSVTSYSSNLLPTDGSVVYVTLSSFQGGVWTRHGTEEFVSAPEPLRVFTFPAVGSTLTAGSAEFGWEAVDGVERYVLRFGSSSGGREYGLKAVGGSVTSYSSNLLPTDGSVVYVTLSSFQGGVWTRHGTEEFVSAPEPLRVFTFPAVGSTLTAGSAEFGWEAVDGVERYVLRFGSSSGGREYGLKAVGGSVTSYSSNLLPTDGSVVYVTLSSFQGGVWTRHGTEEFVSAPEPLRVFTFPAVGSTLTAGSAEFGWEAVDGVERYVLRFGSSSGGREYGLKAVGGSVTSYSSNLLPTDGSVVYVTLSSFQGGVWTRHGTEEFLSSLQ